jgi:hypothetical protein
MARRNRVDPWGDLHAVPERGLLTGNRGCLVDDRGEVVRHHRGRLWITCLIEYRGWRQPLDRPGRWTPIFFLDEAVALAAGHRPCALCRREAYLRYRNAIAAALESESLSAADDLNRRLAAQRLRPGRGLDRATDRILWRLEIGRLPSGAVIVIDGTATLLLDDRVLDFAFTGWGHPRLRPRNGEVPVLTPPTSVAALANGYVPVLHPTATA